MRRNEKDLPEQGQDAAGIHIKRNPGATCVWITKSFRPFKPGVGAPGVLFRLGEPVAVAWFANGRRATRAEVMESIDTGYPALEELARQEGPEAMAELLKLRRTAELLVPAA